MKKIIVMASIFVLSLLLVGCNGKKVKINIDGFKVNTIAIHEDGKIQAARVEEFDRDYYEKDILENFIKEELNEYNQLNGSKEEPLISLESLKVGDGRVKFVLNYSDMEDYVTFNTEDAEYMTLAEAKSAGIIPDRMVDAETSSSIEGRMIEDKDQVYVVVVNEEYEMLVQGKILYYQNGILLDDGKIQTAGQGEKTVVIFKS